MAKATKEEIVAKIAATRAAKKADERFYIASSPTSKVVGGKPTTMYTIMDKQTGKPTRISTTDSHQASFEHGEMEEMSRDGYWDVCTVRGLSWSEIGALHTAGVITLRKGLEP